VPLEDLDSLLLGPGDVGLLPGARSPTPTVFDEEVARADLVVVGRGGLRRGVGGSVAASLTVGEVLSAGEGGEIGRGEFGGDFPLGFLGVGVVEVRALARVREADLYIKSGGSATLSEGEEEWERVAGWRKVELEEGEETDPRVDPGKQDRVSEAQ
jgi:hypothetical protein